MCTEEEDRHNAGSCMRADDRADIVDDDGLRAGLLSDEAGGILRVVDAVAVADENGLKMVVDATGAKTVRWMRMI